MTSPAPRTVQRLGASSSILALGLVLAAAGPAAAEVLISACGQASSDLGYLDADLDCTGFAGPAVIVNGGTFDLRGHTLSGGSRGVECDGPCEITSTLPGGTISNFTEHAISSRQGFDPVPIKVSELTLHANYYGIHNDLSRITATNLTVTDSAHLAIAAEEGRVRAEGVTIAGAYLGVFARLVSFRNSSVTSAAGGIVAHNQLGMHDSSVSATTVAGISACGAMRIRNSTISDNFGNGIGAFCGTAGKATIRDSDISRNGEYGIVMSTQKAKLRNTTVNDNALDGIHTPSQLKIEEGSVVSGNGLHGILSFDGLGFCPRLSVADSAVSGNGLDATCGVAQTCADLSACAAPAVPGSTCGTSHDENSGFPGTDWDVCSLD